MVSPVARWIGATVVVTMASACFPTRTPLRTLDKPGTRHDTLLILLPGFGAHDTTFDKKGLLTELRESGLGADIVAVDATYGYYFREKLIPRIEADIMADARERYDHIWVGGISMGGLGTLVVADAFEEDLDGLLLMSPFMGRRKVAKSVRDAGSLESWTMGEPSWDAEVWRWLQVQQEEGWGNPPIYLGYGTRDLGKANHELIAAALPSDHVMVAEGGHTWPVWKELIGRWARRAIPEHPELGAREAVAEASR